MSASQKSAVVTASGNPGVVLKVTYPPNPAASSSSNPPNPALTFDANFFKKCIECATRPAATRQGAQAAYGELAKEVVTEAAGSGAADVMPVVIEPLGGKTPGAREAEFLAGLGALSRAAMAILADPQVERKEELMASILAAQHGAINLRMEDCNLRGEGLLTGTPTMISRARAGNFSFKEFAWPTSVSSSSSSSTVLVHPDVAGIAAEARNTLAVEERDKKKIESIVTSAVAASQAAAAKSAAKKQDRFFGKGGRGKGKGANTPNPEEK